MEAVAVRIRCLSSGKGDGWLICPLCIPTTRRHMELCLVISAAIYSTELPWLLYKGPYTPSVKLSDFTVRRHTWRKNGVNCAILTGNSAGLRTVLSSRLSHRELHSSLKESHSFFSFFVFIHHSHTVKKHTELTKKSDKPDGKPVLCQRTFSSVFHAVFYTVKLHSST